jgi:hypothetical protein
MKFKEGLTYRHPHMMDTDMFVMKVHEQDEHSAKLTVRYWNRAYMMTMGDADLVVISPFEMDNWRWVGDKKN